VSEPRFLIGIDLGTAHCAVASADLRREGAIEVEDFAIPQLVGLGEVRECALLPSCLYLPEGGEFPPGTLALPWDSHPEAIVGEFARRHGARVPGRLVASAKSWLCHSGVDRTAAILPWGSRSAVSKVSPVEVSAKYLRHLAAAWDQAHPEHPMSEQESVITVPASFDAVARSLTVEAARRAQLGAFSLVEEPQAAFEAFVWEQRQELGRALEGIRLILVVDVGGGTTDFTLVEVAASGNGPSLRRVAVGEHLMLGGDNMDAALARRVEERMTSGGRRLNPVQWSQLIQACREAKEALLGDQPEWERRIVVAGSGSALIGGTLSGRLTVEDVEAGVLDGFLGACGPGERPGRGAASGLQELGLPYARDPSIPRQLAGFLHAHREAGWSVLRGSQSDGEVPSGLPRPDAILLNGGVLKSRRLANRLTEIVSGWWPDAPPIRILEASSLDAAVARGAVCHALARRGLGNKVGGGSSHAIYVGIQGSEGGERLALCVVPRGMEEGTSLDLGEREFRLTTGRPVQFPLYTSTADTSESAGLVVPVREEWTALSPLQAVLPSERKHRDSVAVHLRTTLTTIGTLEVWCVSKETDERWRLEFELRGGAGVIMPGSEAAAESLPARFEQARDWVQRSFPPRGKTAADEAAVAAKAVRQIWAGMEGILGDRAQWTVPVLREIWRAAWEGVARRRRTADHERVFFQLTGYALRPGFGYPGDAWRCEEMADRFAEGVQWAKDRAVWTEFWVGWRRIAGGLTPARHDEIWAFLKPHLRAAYDPAYPKHLGRPKGVQPEGWHEMVRLAAALEHLSPETKSELGEWIAAQIRNPTSTGGPWAWALGRLGARVPLYGSPHNTVEPEPVRHWVEVLLEAHGRGVDGTLFAVAQLARRTGDRSRDVDDDARARALTLLRQSGGPESWVRMVAEVTEMERSDEARAFGDALPVGLAL